MEDFYDFWQGHRLGDGPENVDQAGGGQPLYSGQEVVSVVDTRRIPGAPQNQEYNFMLPEGD